MSYITKHEISCSHQSHTYKEYWSRKITNSDPLLKKSIRIADVTYANYNPNNPSGNTRSKSTIRNKVIYGKLAELFLKEIIDEEIKKQNINGRILESNDETVSFDFETHSDIELDRDGEKYIIEVRSSFPYRPIPEVIKVHFDILGWYTTANKSKEEPKDFYMRILFPFPEQEMQEKIEHGFDLCFVGGATRDLLNSKGVWKNLKQRGATYRVIQPICAALDSKQMLDEILCPN